jgi:F0F1-type ATP synthase assembly protein I
MSQRDQQVLWRLAGRYSAVGIEITVAVVLGTLGGVWADRHFGTAPVFLCLGLAVGFGAATQIVVRLIRTAGRSKDS